MPTNLVVFCSNGFSTNDGYTATPGVSFRRTVTGLPPAEECELSIFSSNTVNYNPETDTQRIPFNTTGLNAGGGGQGGNSEGPTTPGSTIGETITVPNNFGMCNSYRWDGTKWVKTNQDPFLCNQSGGNECSIIDDLNYQNCCIERTGNAIACKKYTDAGGTGPGGDGTLLGGDQNTNPQGGATTPGSITPTPQASSAALKSCNAIAFNSILDILIWLKCVIAAAIIPLIFTLAFLFFLWGMTMYIRGSDDVKKREESKKFIYWGIIALTVMISVWGIVKIINTTLGFGNTVPKLQTDYLKTPVKP